MALPCKAISDMVAHYIQEEFLIAFVQSQHAVVPAPTEHVFRSLLIQCSQA